MSKRDSGGRTNKENHQESRPDPDLLLYKLVRRPVPKLKLVAGFSLVAIAAVLAVPYESVIVPEWRIEVVSEDGAPAAFKEIRQEWAPSERATVSSDLRLSDQNGFVTFPERVYFAPLAVKIFVLLGDLLNAMLMPHGAGIGPHARVLPVSDNYYFLTYTEGRPLETRLMIRPLFE